MKRFLFQGDKLFSHLLKIPKTAKIHFLKLFFVLFFRIGLIENVVGFATKIPASETIIASFAVIEKP